MTAIVISAMLMIPKMVIESPGKGVLAKLPGTVTKVTENTVEVTNPKAGVKVYHYTPKVGDIDPDTKDILLLPKKEVLQEPVVKVGDEVNKKQLLVKGTTKIFFQGKCLGIWNLGVIVGAIWGNWGRH